MPFDYEAIIIGSGFGATVVATELATRHPNTNNKPNLLMLERGVWWFTPERTFPETFKPHYDTAYPPGTPDKQPVQYWPRPDHRRGLLELLSVVWANVPGGDRRDSPGSHPQPLYRYNAFDEIDIITASGVGGGSLIYSNVSIRPFFDTTTNTFPVMENWPVQLTQADYNDATGWMTSFRGPASQVVTKFPPNGGFPDLKALPPGEKYAYLGKCRWLKEAAEALALDPQWVQQIVSEWEPLDLAIIEYPDPNPKPEQRTFCERQGRCFLGCLPGARHTLNKTLVKHLLYPTGQPPAVEMRSLAEVTKIEKLPAGGYKIHYEDLHFGDGPFDDPAKRHRTVTAGIVVAAAGCLSTNELMLKSKNAGLRLSDMVGRRFSTNGDFAGFIDYRRKENDPLHFNTAPFPIFATRGPINASHVSFRDGRLLVNFEDATIPPMLAPFVRASLEVMAGAADQDPFLSIVQAMWKLQFEDLTESADPRKADQYMTEHELLQNTFFFNLMGRDESRGVFTLDGNNKLQLRFEGGPLTSDPVYKKMEEIVQAMVAKMGGEYFRFPFWGKGKLLNNQPDPDRKFVTVHPLGGCRIGTNSSEGVVNSKGQVFDTANGGNTVHDGLYLADASVIPGPVAVNPTLTIVAMAKKIAANIP